MAFLGRREIFTDEKEITKSNIENVIGNAFITHLRNKNEMETLFNYAKGYQPILKRVKEIRPEINEKVVDNIASEVLQFKLGYEFGNPVSYVQRARKDADTDNVEVPNDDDKRISTLNEMMGEECKSAKDLKLAKDVKTCGVGYRMVLPKKNVTGISPFSIIVLNPLTTFVIKSNDIYKNIMLSVTYCVHDNGSVSFGAYTDTRYFEFLMQGSFSGSTIKEYPNVLGINPIIEYVNDYDRMGCFERVIPLMNSLNKIGSDRVNDIAQHVQNLLWGDNVELDEESYQKLRENGMVMTKSQAGRQATLKYLESVLNQSENQTLVDYTKQQILDITNTPSRSELSGGSTGSATNMSTGWMAAETDAKEKEEIFKESAKQETLVVLQILRTSTSVEGYMQDMAISDIEIKFSRSRTYDLATKVNSLATLLNAGIDPLRSIEIVGLFTDPQQVFLDSAERIDEILFSKKEQADAAEEVNDKTDKLQADISDQIDNKTSIGDESN